MSAMVAIATLLTRAASSDVLFTDHVDVTDHDEVGLLQLHRDTSSIAKAGKRQEPQEPRDNPCVPWGQTSFTSGPDDTFYDSLNGLDLPVSIDNPDSFYQQNRFCWRIDTDQEGWDNDVTPRVKRNTTQPAQYVRGGSVVQWTVTPTGMVERPGDAVTKRTDCYYPWHHRNRPVKDRNFSLPGMQWCSEKGRYCTEGITVRGITTMYPDGAYGIMADGVFSLWGGCDGGENWKTHITATENLGDCSQICRRQNKDSNGGCWIACNCVYLPDLDPCTIDSGACEHYEAVAITDGDQCLDAAEALHLPLENPRPGEEMPASRAIYLSEAYFGCLYGDNTTDTKAVTGQNLWYGGSRSRHGQESIPAGFQQLCTPRVAKIAGGCSASSDGSWKPITDPVACENAAHLVGNVHPPVSGTECYVDSSRAEELCTKD